MVRTLFTVAVVAFAAQVVQAAKPVTFSEDIAPIVFQKCTTCHRPGQAGPFPLLTYEDVKQRAETIEAVVQEGYMPPWPPSSHHAKFSNDRRLTDDQKAELLSWIRGGTPEGDRSKLPPQPVYPDGWSLGEPDLIATMDGEFKVPADGPDLYRSFVIRVDLPEDKWVKAVELRPKARSLVHHALYFAVDSDAARERDARTPEAGFNGMASPIRERLGGYVPGVMPERLPEDLAQPLPAGTDIVVQTHFHPSGKAETEQLTIGLYFTDKAPSRDLQGIQLPPLFGRVKGINIAPGDSHWVLEDNYTLPVPVKAYLVSGHAHYICQQMDLTATLPDGSKQTLLEINDWDLNWQGQYRFAKPIDLPAGARLDAKLVYDNSTANPQNPFSPPRRITWGEESNDEMGSLTLMVVCDSKADSATLRRNYGLKLLEGGGKGRIGEEIRQKLGGLDGRTFDFLDRNRDGKIQRSEMPEKSRLQGFNFLDTDENGTIEREEWDEVSSRARGEGSAPAARPGSGLERLKKAFGRGT